METLLTLFSKQLIESMQRAFGSSLTKEDLSADVTPCAQEEFGHYQCNAALRLSKILKMNPRVVAHKIIDHLDET